MTTTAPPLPPQPIYTPRPARSSRLPAFLGYWFAFALMFFMPAALFIYAVSVWDPQVILFYRDFKTQLPGFTEWLLAEGSDIQTIRFWVEIILAVGLCSMLLAGITALMPRGFLRAAIAMFSMLVILVLTVIEAVVLYNGLFGPMVTIIHHVSGE
ncbi:MAG TPA: hypothetical protein VH253_13350 [Phycisphaerae bacterium]|nr:hypothetical protein [Phycisphaerae bacterium]